MATIFILLIGIFAVSNGFSLGEFKNLFSIKEFEKQLFEVEQLLEDETEWTNFKVISETNWHIFSYF